MTKKELNQKIVALNKAIDTLRSDMAAEFVKRDAQIEALRYVVAPIYKDIQDKVQEIREVVSELGKEDQDTEFGLFGGMDKAVADFDKACEDVASQAGIPSIAEEHNISGLLQKKPRSLMTI